MPFPSDPRLASGWTKSALVLLACLPGSAHTLTAESWSPPPGHPCVLSTTALSQFCATELLHPSVKQRQSRHVVQQKQLQLKQQSLDYLTRLGPFRSYSDLPEHSLPAFILFLGTLIGIDLTDRPIGRKGQCRRPWFRRRGEMAGNASFSPSSRPMWFIQHRCRPLPPAFLNQARPLDFLLRAPTTTHPLRESLRSRGRMVSPSRRQHELCDMIVLIGACRSFGDHTF